MPRRTQPSGLLPPRWLVWAGLAFILGAVVWWQDQRPKLQAAEWVRLAPCYWVADVGNDGDSFLVATPRGERVSSEPGTVAT